MVCRLTVFLVVLLGCSSIAQCFRQKHKDKAALAEKELRILKAKLNAVAEHEAAQTASAETQAVRQIQIWGWTTCGYYQAAVRLALQRYPNAAVQTNGLPSRSQFKAWLSQEAANYGPRASRWTSSPFVVVDGNFVGGYDDFSRFARTNSFMEEGEDQTSNNVNDELLQFQKGLLEQSGVLFLIVRTNNDDAVVYKHTATPANKDRYFVSPVEAYWGRADGGEAEFDWLAPTGYGYKIEGDQMTMTAFSKVKITLREDGSGRMRAMTTIAGKLAYLRYIWVKLNWISYPSYVNVHGDAVDGSGPVVERVNA